MKPAHILVDFQNDFVDEKWSLTTQAAHLWPVIDEIITLFRSQELPTISTQDRHPSDHSSFASVYGAEPTYTDNGRPDHCIADTRWAQIHPSITQAINHAIYKWKDKSIEEYSGFVNGELEPYLRSQDIDTLFLSWIATDYCVQATALDALKAWFVTYVIQDAVKSVAEDPTSSIDTMKQSWVIFVTSDQLSSLLLS